MSVVSDMLVFRSYVVRHGNLIMKFKKKLLVFYIMLIYFEAQCFVVLVLQIEICIEEMKKC